MKLTINEMRRILSMRMQTLKKLVTQDPTPERLLQIKTVTAQIKDAKIEITEMMLQSRKARFVRLQKAGAPETTLKLEAHLIRDAEVELTQLRMLEALNIL